MKTLVDEKKAPLVVSGSQGVPKLVRKFLEEKLIEPFLPVAEDHREGIFALQWIQCASPFGSSYDKPCLGEVAVVGGRCPSRSSPSRFGCFEPTVRLTVYFKDRRYVAELKPKGRDYLLEQIVDGVKLRHRAIRRRSPVEVTELQTTLSPTVYTAGSVVDFLDKNLKLPDFYHHFLHRLMDCADEGNRLFQHEVERVYCAYLGCPFKHGEEVRRVIKLLCDKEVLTFAGDARTNHGLRKTYTIINPCACPLPFVSKDRLPEGGRRT